jgi:hypothetical protein
MNELVTISHEVVVADLRVPSHHLSCRNSKKTRKPLGRVPIVADNEMRYVQTRNDQSNVMLCRTAHNNKCPFAFIDF